MAEISLHRTSLPWSDEPGDIARLALALGLMLVIFIPLAIVVPRIQIPEPDRAEMERTPPQLARFLAPPPEPVVEPKPQTGPELKPAPAPESRPQPMPRPEPRREPVTTEPPREPVSVSKPQPEALPAVRQTVKEARAVASQSGLMALQDQLSAMRQEHASDSRPMQANVADESAPVEPKPVAQTLTKGSGGVESQAGPARSVALADHAVQSVAAPRPVAAASSRPSAGKPGPSQRALSNIRRVFSQQKSALYALYNRELRKDPTLAGRVVLELVIEPDGTVSRSKVIESELDRPRLEQTIANRVRLFNFGRANVEARTVRFPIDFLPS